MILGGSVRHCCTDFAVRAALTHAAFDGHTLEVRRQGMARVARKALSRLRSVQSLPANCTLRPLPLGAQQWLALKVSSQAIASVASFTLVVSRQVGRGLAGFACWSLTSAAQVLGAGEVVLVKHVASIALVALIFCGAFALRPALLASRPGPSLAAEGLAFRARQGEARIARLTLIWSGSLQWCSATFAQRSTSCPANPRTASKRWCQLIPGTTLLAFITRSTSFAARFSLGTARRQDTQTLLIECISFIASCTLAVSCPMPGVPAHLAHVSGSSPAAVLPACSIGKKLESIIALAALVGPSSLHGVFANFTSSASPGGTLQN
mmetsp:Transcript_56279/g.134298  ORF Transcript_56279/g.134298 Transcript_56279/m.134298 type:complete len:323 (-) Transcript_56279:2313-3281(-)